MRSTMFYAHSLENRGPEFWETLVDHLEAAAAAARRLGVEIGIGAICEIAARLHDLGKFDPGFQRYLAGAKERVPHSIAGAAAIMDCGGTREEKAVAILIAQAIAGHHAGLPDRTGSDAASLAERKGAFDFTSLSGPWQDFVPENLDGLGVTFAGSGSKREEAQRYAMLGRMIFSCLVDADFLETERFYVERGERQKDRDWPSLAACLPRFQKRFDAKIAGFDRAASEIAGLRHEILTSVRERAKDLEPGLFTLDVPTGGGKTLASLGFALDHAEKWGHRRIIYGIPFTSIIDQTAEIFRDVLGADAILEHHSAIEDERHDSSLKDADTRRSGKDKMRLAMENWAAPVVVTTHVQLFESLFAARTSRARKLHNIAGSVIILDEAQVLPKHLLAPTVRAIDVLARDWGCSIVLCTATQPAFDASNFSERHPLALDLEGRELAPDPKRLHGAFRRNRLVQAGEMHDEALVAALKDEPQALVIVNSRAHALELFTLAQEAGLDGLVHLTTRQCAAHRRAILKDVRARLANGEPCRLIATSLVEAGVDIDFPKAWRAEAGLESIIQAAGRVNREMKRDADACTVTVFKPAGRKPPREIAALARDTENVARRQPDLFAREAIDDYFGEVYWRMGEDGLDAGPIADGETRGILRQMSHTRVQGLDIAYRTIAERYRMIEDGMAAVVIPFDEAARAAVEKLSIPDVSSGAIARELQS